MNDNFDQLWLSPHFTLGEMYRSGTAIRCNINNKPTVEEMVRFQKLLFNCLEPLRQKMGRTLISSGFRCRALNSEVGGSPDSQHMLGEAADIYCSNQAYRNRVFDFLRGNTDFDQLILEPTWVHVSYTERRKNRHQVIQVQGLTHGPRS